MTSYQIYIIQSYYLELEIPDTIFFCSERDFHIQNAIITFPPGGDHSPDASRLLPLGIVDFFPFLRNDCSLYPRKGRYTIYCIQGREKGTTVS